MSITNKFSRNISFCLLLYTYACIHRFEVCHWWWWWWKKQKSYWGIFVQCLHIHDDEVKQTHHFASSSSFFVVFLYFSSSISIVLSSCLFSYIYSRDYNQMSSLFTIINILTWNCFSEVFFYYFEITFPRRRWKSKENFLMKFAWTFKAKIKSSRRWSKWCQSKGISLLSFIVFEEEDKDEEKSNNNYTKLLKRRRKENWVSIEARGYTKKKKNRSYGMRILRT